MFEFKAKTAGITLAIIVAMLLVVAGANWLSGISKGISQTIKNSSGNEEKIGLPETKLKKDGDRTNILILGIGGPDHISGTLTDSLIFASAKVDQNEADFISMPRDMWVFYSSEGYPAEGISGYTYKQGWQKINEIYHLSGGQEKPNIEAAGHIAKKVSDITGHPVHYTVIINLDGIKEIVDIIGGIEIDGVQMSGDEATAYVRDRSGPGSDFDRMKHQQEVLLAIQKKLGGENDLGFTEVLELYNTAQKNILLAEEYIDLNGQNIYILRPSAGLENYDEIQNFINKILDI